MASVLEALQPYLPQHEGILPKWLLFVSIISIANSIQAYTTLTYTARVYSENPSPSSTPSKAKPVTPLAPNSTVTPLQARTFGTWTVIQSLVRLSAAYNISNGEIYKLAYGTYLVALLHFGAEWKVFGTAKWGAPLAGPVIIASGTLVWMAMQWNFYVQ
ncbi:ergosterol 28 [Bisporella sp. PMI_857]|nr:ergosterol 28 [Bisporella sp. PMI_857]